MSEYDASPAAMAAFRANKQKCANWASKTAGYANDFKVPFGARSDVDDSEFYKLRPGEEDDIEVGSMGVPDHERMAMEASIGMHPQRHSHRHHHHHGYPQPPMPPMMMGHRERRRSMSHGPSSRATYGSGAPTFVIDSPPPSAGFSHGHHRRSSSRAAPPPSLAIPMTISPVHSPHPSAGSQGYFSPAAAPFGAAPTPHHLGHGGVPPAYMMPPPPPGSSRVASPVSASHHHHHSSSSHHHHRSHRDKSEKRHRSKSVSRGPATYIYSPPVSPPGSPSPMSAMSVAGYGGSRPPSVVYMPAGPQPHSFAPPMRYAAVY